MRLKEIRKSKGIKQNKVAKDLGLNVVTYNGYETGKSQPNIEMILKLAKYFNVTTDKLLGADKIEEVSLTEKKTLLDRINELNEMECHKLNIFAEGLMSLRVEHKDKINNLIKEDDEE